MDTKRYLAAVLSGNLTAKADSDSLEEIHRLAHGLAYFAGAAAVFWFYDNCQRSGFQAPSLPSLDEARRRFKEGRAGLTGKLAWRRRYRSKARRNSKGERGG